MRSSSRQAPTLAVTYRYERRAMLRAIFLLAFFFPATARPGCEGDCLDLSHRPVPRNPKIQFMNSTWGSLIKPFWVALNRRPSTSLFRTSKKTVSMEATRKLQLLNGKTSDPCQRRNKAKPQTAHLGGGGMANPPFRENLNETG